MRMNMRGVTAAAMALLATGALGDPGTAFTYQGRLNVANAPANGSHDLRFRMFDAASGGLQVSATLCADNVQVIDGVFTVLLDFGNIYSAGDTLFLEADVRPDSGLTCADGANFTTLTPRQGLTITPFAAYATQARTAINAESADNSNALGGQASTFYRNAANLNTGTIPDLRLSTNVPRLNAASTFTGAVTMTNAANQFAGAGGGLVGLNATNLTTGTVADGLLSSNIARLNGVNLFTNAGNVFVGDGSGLTGLSASGLSGQIVGSQIANDAISTFHIAPGAIIGSDISDNSIGTTKILNGAITSFKLAAGSVSGGVGGTIADGSIGNSDLQANMIASVNIIDGTITAADLANDAVTGGLILDNSITAPDLAPGSVGSSEIADGSVGSTEIAANAVTAAKLAVDAVGNTRLTLDAGSLLRVTGGAMQSNGTHIGIGGAPSATHELFVEGRIQTTTGMNTTGTIDAAEFTFLNPFPRVYGVGIYDFVREDGGIAFGETNGNAHDGQPFLYNTSLLVNVSAGAPVHLPDGASVTQLEVFVIDSSNFDMTVQLLRRGFDGASGGTMAQVLSSGDVIDTVRSFTDTTISAPIIDNANFQYYVRIFFPPGNQPINFKGAIIRYTVPRPLP